MGTYQVLFAGSEPFKSMHILRVPSFFPSKKNGGSIKRGAGSDPALAEVVYPTTFLTSASSTGDILYYLLAGGTEFKQQINIIFMALSGGDVPCFSKAPLNSLHINSQC